MPARRRFVGIVALGFGLALAASLSWAGPPVTPTEDGRVVERASDAPQPMSPAQSLAKVRLPAGFRMQLVASEPVVVEPSCLAFDEWGRMFVTELHGYNVEGEIDVAQLNKSGKLDREVRRIRWEVQGGAIAEQAAQRQRGVVKLLQDTDGDGVMDQSRIWADDLPPCYGVVPARGGVIVVCAPDIVFLADRDHDGMPDVRETLFTGFRVHVLERGVNNPRWGTDNWIYVGAGSGGGTITGPYLSDPVELPHCDFRIKPDGSAIEPVSGQVGTFGLTMNDFGDRFPSTGGRPAMYALPLPFRYLSRNPFVSTPATNQYAVDYNRGYRISEPHPWRVRRGEDPAWVEFYGARETNSIYFSGGCSNEIYRGGLFPTEYQGNLFYCEPSLNIIHRCVLSQDGAAYRGRRADDEQESEFLASRDQWFRPMNLRVGPEGALYIVDMYREIIEDYSAIPRFLQQQYGLDRGRDHGRIWRLEPDGVSVPPIPNLAQLTSAELVSVLDTAEPWQRLTAQRLLVERDAQETTSPLRQLLAMSSRWQTQLHVLYTLTALNSIAPADIVPFLSHDRPELRVHALRLIDPWLDRDPEVLAKVIKLTDDTDARVRLQLALSLGETQNKIATQALIAMAHHHGRERWMDSAILSSSWGRASEMLKDLISSADDDAIGEEFWQPLAATLVGVGDPTQVSACLVQIATVEPSIQAACLRGMLDTATNQSKPAFESGRSLESLAAMMRSNEEEVRRLALDLVGRLGLPLDGAMAAAVQTAVNEVFNMQNSLPQRVAAASWLSELPADQLAGVTTRLMKVDQPTELQVAAIEHLAESPHSQLGRILLVSWNEATPVVRRAILKAIAARRDRLDDLLDALETQQLATSDIPSSLIEQLKTSESEDTRRRAEQLFAQRDATIDVIDVDAYRKALKGSSHTARGKVVFTTHCVNCHRVGEHGIDVGPPLGTIANKPDETVLLDILHPNDRIEPEYESYTITTHDGRSFSGVLASESATSILLRMEKGESKAILRRDVEQLAASRVSLMPSNFHELIKPQDAADLIAFLRQELANAGNSEP